MCVIENMLIILKGAHNRHYLPSSSTRTIQLICICGNVSREEVKREVIALMRFIVDYQQKEKEKMLILFLVSNFLFFVPRGKKVPNLKQHTLKCYVKEIQFPIKI